MGNAGTRQYEVALKKFEGNANSDEATPTLKEIHHLMGNTWDSGQLLKPKILHFWINNTGVFTRRSLRGARLILYIGYQLLYFQLLVKSL